MRSGTFDWDGFEPPILDILVVPVDTTTQEYVPSLDAIVALIHG